MNGTTGSARTGDDLARLIRNFYSIGNLMMNDDNEIFISKLHDGNSEYFQGLDYRECRKRCRNTMMEPWRQTRQYLVPKAKSQRDLLEALRCPRPSPMTPAVRVVQQIMSDHFPCAHQELILPAIACRDHVLLAQGLIT